MFFKVLYTHQKLKKNKTWQDGFLEILPTGKKAILLSEERKSLENIYTAREKIFPDAEIESEKFLIQIENECIMEEHTARREMTHEVQQRLPQNIQRVTVSRHGISAKQGHRKSFRPPLMEKNATLKQTKSNTRSLASNLEPSHPSLSGNGNRLVNNYRGMPSHNRENTSFHNLYSSLNSEQHEKEEGVFSVPMAENVRTNSQREDAIGKVTEMERINQSLPLHRHELPCNSSVINRSIIKKEPLVPAATRQASTYPIKTSSTSIKRSTSEIIALFSKRSKQCYRDNIPTKNILDNHCLNTIKTAQDQTSIEPAECPVIPRPLSTVQDETLVCKSRLEGGDIHVLPGQQNTLLVSDNSLFDLSDSELNASFSDSKTWNNSCNMKNSQSQDFLSRSMPPENDPLYKMSNLATQDNISSELFAGIKQSPSSSGTRISSEDFINSFKKENENPLPHSLSEYPGSLFPYQGLTSGKALQGSTHSLLDAARRTSNEENNMGSGETFTSPVFNPGNKERFNISELQSKPPFKSSSSSIKGAVTSNVVRRSELNHSVKDIDVCNISACDGFKADNTMISAGDDWCGETESPLADFENNFNQLPITSSVNNRTALTSGPTDTLGHSTTKRSPFAFVPTPNLDIQDDELTLYSDGDLYAKRNVYAENQVKSQQHLARRVGLSKGKHALVRGTSLARSLAAPINDFGNESRLKENGTFKAIYSSFVQENGNGMKSMFGELCFPSLEDAEANPTPLRLVKIPIEFENLNEYKSTFRAALREHLNILLFDLAKNYHIALKKADISLDFENNTGTANKTQSGPSCPHGECRLRSVRKEGPNKGKLFFCCPGTAAAQCKFFIWAEEYQKKSGITNASDIKLQSKINLSDISSVSTFFNGQALAFYCGCTLLKKSKNSFQSKVYRGRGNKWGKASRYGDELDTGKKCLYISLPFKRSSSTYGKDDLWIISKNFSFDPRSTFIAKSTFYGPTSSGEVQITAVSSYSPSNWESGETVHALLACNAGTELTCINNLDEISNITEIPVLPHLISRENYNKKQKLSSNSKFNCPALKDSKETTLLPKEYVIKLCEETITQYSLNEDQAGALKSIANMFCQFEDSSTESHITLIHGVFGAGKSFLLAVVIVFLVDLFKKNQENNCSWKILVSSTTNVAVDRVLQGLLEIGFDDFVRVGSMKKIAKPVLPYSVHATGSNDQELKELQSMLKGDLSPSEKTYVRKSIEKHRLGLNRKRLQEVPVVGVTCAASVFPCMAKLSFKVHLLDECSQMTEPLSLLPIARFKCERLILVGDPKQLSPTIQGSEADHKFGLERTLFDRLKQKGHDPILLRTQYRCHPMISAMPNELFYKGQLKDGVTAEQRAPMISWLNTLCFYNVSKGREKCGNDGSYYNEEEAKFVVFLINSMLLFDTEPSKIGVITQYKSQVWKISSLLREQSSNIAASELQGIQISTVDAFQGAEKEIIILSCVRTDHVGFIDCDRRTNVALSRAKRHLLIVGNLKMLVKNSLWTRIIECCERNKDGVVSAKQFLETVEPQLAEKRRLVEEAGEGKSKKRKRNITSQSSQKQKKRRDKTSVNASTAQEMYAPFQDSDSLSCSSETVQNSKFGREESFEIEDKLSEIDTNEIFETSQFADFEEYKDLETSEEIVHELSKERFEQQQTVCIKQSDNPKTKTDLVCKESPDFPIFFNLL